MNIDDRYLIDLVREFEVIYNKLHVDFKNKSIRMNAWNTIGEVLGTEGNACEQRFNVLRAKYNVERKKMSSLLSGSSSSKDWKLFKLLSFLDSHIVTRNLFFASNCLISFGKDLRWQIFTKIFEECCSSPVVKEPKMRKTNETLQLEINLFT
ncbi:hypothetical protein RN001_000468 [Aquatica leii]|uniref:MADF domain-containing protein n=1 Tax=Aquatica leii TaxID=1421715 RepID=A0AAN7Q743_9COLE|nr:hypothetical protein RN001_000468 [Aquatica leii]